jgi:integrase
MGVLVREKVKGSGEWWVFVNHNNKRRSRKVGDKRTANGVKKGIEKEIAKGTWDTEEGSKLPTLAVQGQKFIDSPLRKWSERTHRESQIVFDNHVKPALGKKPIDEIKPRHVKELLASVLGKGLSSASARAVLRILSGILEDVREDDLISTNPCMKMGRYCGNGRVKKINPLEAHEVGQLLENAQTLPIEIRTMILVGVRTGLRIGELLALDWSDVDLEERTLEVSKSWDYHRKKMSKTKTGASRTVRLTHQTVAGLKELRDATKYGKIVFCDKNGGRLPHKRMRNWLKVVAPRYITPHDLRHTYATLRLAKGDNLVDVSKQLGHSSIETTLRHYTHWIPSETYIAQVDELDNLHLSAPYPHPGVPDKPELH